MVATALHAMLVICESEMHQVQRIKVLKLASLYLFKCNRVEILTGGSRLVVAKFFGSSGSIIGATQSLVRGATISLPRDTPCVMEMQHDVEPLCITFLESGITKLV